MDPNTLMLLKTLGPSIAGGVYNAIFPDKVRAIQMEVIGGMQERRSRLMRMARGDFTGAERQEIEQGAEPGLNRLAGNVAQRGLGTSGAGAQVMADASILPFTQAQADAEGKLNQVDTSITAALAAIPQQPDILSGLGQLSGKFAMIDKLKMEQAQADADETGTPTPVQPDGVFEGFLQGFMEFLEMFGQMDIGEFDPSAMDGGAE